MACLLRQACIAQTVSSHIAVASRMLKKTPNTMPGNHEMSSIADSAREILEGLYYPATFNCEGLISRKRNMVSCHSLRSICNDGVCGLIEWDASFDSSLKPEKEQICISHSSNDCGVLDGKMSCYGFNYNGDTATSCIASIDNKMCNSCEICGHLDEKEEKVQFIAPDCSNISGFESKVYECKDVRILDDMFEILFQCPRLEDHEELVSFDFNACKHQCKMLRWAPRMVKKCIKDCNTTRKNKKKKQKQKLK